MSNYTKKHIFIVTTCWLIVNMLVYMTLGVKYAADTTRFDYEASSWLSGTFEFSYHFWYTAYIAILALCKFIFHSIYPSIIIQYTLSLISILLFYIGLSHIVKNEWVGLMAAVLIILYIPIQQWNTCLLTESFYISAILLFIWIYSFENTPRKWIVLFSDALIASLLRPNGGIMLLTFFLVAAPHVITKKNRIYFYALGICISIGILVLLNTATTVFYHFLIDSFNKGEVICGYSGWTVSIPSHIEPEDSTGSIIKIMKLLISNPVQCMQLAAYRLIALYTDVRMYYSSYHNTFISIFLLVTYVSAWIGISRDRKKYSGLFLITVFYIGLNSMLVMITYADWDGRFLAPLLPVIFIWSALGMHHIYKQLFITLKTN